MRGSDLPQRDAQSIPGRLCAAEREDDRPAPCMTTTCQVLPRDRAVRCDLLQVMVDHEEDARVFWRGDDCFLARKLRERQQTNPAARGLTRLSLQSQPEDLRHDFLPVR